MNPRSLSFLVLALSIWLAFPSAFADEKSKPFAERRVVLQISDNDPTKQTLVLNVANNLLKHYGQDKVDVEIVAFGPGLRLLFSGNASSNRIEALHGAGVRFSACENTISAITKKLGEPPVLNSNAVPVAAGVVRILELQDQGFELIKP